MKKEMLINVLQPEECRIAIVEDGVLEELYVERTSLENYTGNIYKGRIVNIEAAIQAAFVDFSVGRNGFLHVSDVEPHYYRRLLTEESELGARDRGRDPRQFDRPEPRGGPPRIEERGGRSAASPHPTAYDDEPRGRERERPDRSDKSRRSRSERRFGEGLTDEWDLPLSPRPAAPPPPPPPPPRPEPPRRTPRKTSASAGRSPTGQRARRHPRLLLLHRQPTRIAAGCPGRSNRSRPSCHPAAPSGRAPRLRRRRHPRWNRPGRRSRLRGRGAVAAGASRRAFRGPIGRARAASWPRRRGANAAPVPSRPARPGI